MQMWVVIVQYDGEDRKMFLGPYETENEAYSARDMIMKKFYFELEETGIVCMFDHHTGYEYLLDHFGGL